MQSYKHQTISTITTTIGYYFDISISLSIYPQIGSHTVQNFLNFLWFQQPVFRSEFCKPCQTRNELFEILIEQPIVSFFQKQFVNRWISD